MTRTVLALLAISMISGCFLSPSWRKSHAEHKAQRREIAQARRDAELARLRFCAAEPGECQAESMASAEELRERKPRRAQAIMHAIETQRRQAPPAQSAGVSCETRTIGATAYTDCR